MAAEAAAATGKRKLLRVCDVCDANPWKYRCPACDARTCSLACLKKHKAETKCTGKRSRTEFVALQDFDDRQLLSDYAMLEDVARMRDVNQRERPACVDAKRRKVQDKLHRAALARGVRLQFLSPGMERRRENSSRVCRKEFWWRVEWRFRKAGVSVVDKSVRDTVILTQALAKHLEVTAGNRLFKLKEYMETGVQGLKAVLRKEGTSAAAPQYYEIKLDSNLQENLAGKKIVEFPVIQVLLPGEMQDVTLADEGQ